MLIPRSKNQFKWLLMNKLVLFFMLMLSGVWAQTQSPANDVLMQHAGTIRFGFDSGCENTFGVPAKLEIAHGDELNFGYANPESGNFAFLPGSYTITPRFENADYFTMTPASADVEIGGGLSANFCVSPNGIHHDVEVTVLPQTHAVSEQLSGYRVMVRNTGNQLSTGVVRLSYPSDRVAMVSATPAVSRQSTSHLQWDYSNLRPFATQSFAVHFQTGTLTSGDVLTFTANVITGVQDETPGNNTIDIRQSAAMAVESNNKLCLEGDVLPPSMIGEYLNYVINFRNEGPSIVQKVVVNDEIDTNQFEISSLQVIDMSHPGIPVIIGNKAEFYFQDINLSPGAYGYVAFKIKTKPTLPAGSTVSNKAKIYFDFNAPLNTNTAFTTFQLLGLPENHLPTAKIYPNPAKDFVTVEASHEMLSVKFVDAQGRTVCAIPANGMLLAHDLSAYSPGVYYLTITTANGTVNRKVVKH